MDKKEKREPSAAMSLVVFLVAMGIILVGLVILGWDIHITMLLALAFACLVSAPLGYSFDDLVECMKKTLGQSMAAMIIFIFIGIIIAAWIFSGTVPSLIYYGLQYLTPKLFLPVGLLLCSITSMSIGTCWGTVGTMGIALMGIGSGLGIPAPLTAGVVISGASFGDKMSPISDTTNLAPAAAGTTLARHVSSMWTTTIPAYIITFICCTIIGIFYQHGEIDHAAINVFTDTISANFRVSPILLLPAVVLLLLNIRQFPAIPGMAIGSLLAVLLAVFYQGFSVKDVIAGLNYGYNISTGVEIVDTLLLRGGVQSMMNTFSLACIAISFGGVMERVGYLHKVLGLVVKHIKSDRLMVPLVIGAATVGTAAMGEVYLTIVLNGNLFKEEFKKRGLRLEMLSRLLEEGGTLTQVFVPWSTTSMFYVSILGVTTAQYAKYVLLNYINPLLSIALALTVGYGVIYNKQPCRGDKRCGGMPVCEEEAK